VSRIANVGAFGSAFASTAKNKVNSSDVADTALISFLFIMTFY
jgi:hypothetical protein